MGLATVFWLNRTSPNFSRILLELH